MGVARVGFACAVDNYGERIYAIGGSQANHKATDVCEVYLVEEDKWLALQPLPEPRFS